VAEANRYDAMAVSCWPRFQEVMQIAPCAAYAWLNQMGMTIADEGDALGAVSMLALRAASRLPTTMMDLVAVDEEQDQVHFWHCGPTAPLLADREGARLTYHPTLDRAQPANAPRRGAAMDLVMRPGPATIMRLTRAGKNMFLLSADVVEKATRGYEGSRAWFGNLRMNGIAINIPTLLETMAYYGIEHHYPIALTNVETILREVAAWLGSRILTPISYADYLQNPVRDP
jgi:L-fucose isomerase-like protein